jgi:hypothetical protein
VSFTVGIHGLMTRTTAGGTIVNKIFTNAGFFHYNKILEKLQSRNYLQTFYSMSSFSYARLSIGNANALLIYSREIIHLSLFLSTLCPIKLFTFLGFNAVYCALFFFFLLYFTKY